MKNYYRENFSTINQVTQNRRSNISIEELHKKLHIKCNEEELSFDDFISQLNNKKNFKCLLSSQVGMGKTTILQYLCYQNINKKVLNNFQLVYLDLTNITDDTKTIDDIIQANYGNTTNLELNKTKLYIFDNAQFIKDRGLINIIRTLNNDSILIVSFEGCDKFDLKFHSTCIIDGFIETFEETIAIVKTKGHKAFEECDNSFTKLIRKLHFDKDIEVLYRTILYIWHTPPLRHFIKNPLFLEYLIVIISMKIESEVSIIDVYIEFIEKIMFHNKNTKLSIDEQYKNNNELLLKIEELINDKNIYTIKNIIDSGIVVDKLIQSGLMIKNNFHQFKFQDNYFYFFFLAKKYLNYSDNIFENNLNNLNNLNNDNIIIYQFIYQFCKKEKFKNKKIIVQKKILNEITFKPLEEQISIIDEFQINSLDKMQLNNLIKEYEKIDYILYKKFEVKINRIKKRNRYEYI